MPNGPTTRWLGKPRRSSGLERIHPGSSLQLAIPAYFPPGADWERLVGAGPAVELAILNMASGPGDVVDTGYLPTREAARNAGVALLGYVDTDNGARPPAAVDLDIERFVTWYGVDGIFLDRADVSCGTIASYYIPLRKRLAETAPGLAVALNPGMPVPECFMEACDVLVDFEGSANSYLETRWPSWRSAYGPDPFWHIVYGVEAASVLSTIERCRSLAGRCFLTDQHLDPDPPDAYLYDRLPADPMWRRTLGALD